MACLPESKLEVAHESSTTITTIRPSAVSYQPTEYNAVNKQPLELGVLASVFVLPADVNFGKIKINEGECKAEMNGFFTRFDGIPAYEKHPEGKEVEMERHIEGKGTLMKGDDNVGMNTAFPPQVPQVAHHGYSPGTYKLKIPQFYHLNGDRGQFATADFVAEITVHQTSHEATLSLDKNGFLAKVGEDSDPSPTTFPPHP